MRYLIIILTALLILVIPGTAFAQESTEGTISGQVINGTEGGSSVAEVEVILLTYIDNTLDETRTTETDEEGKFLFNNVALEHQYIITTKYMEVDYYYEAVFNAGETETHVEVGVCDTTTSDQEIRVGLAHKIVSVEKESLTVTEVFWFINGGDRTYIGIDGVLLVFPIPDEAITFEAPQELISDFQLLDNNNLTYLVPFPPGERQIVYSYSLARPDSNELIIPMEINYPTDVFELLISGEEIEVSVNHLLPAEPVVTDTGERFIHYQGENLTRNIVINLQISGLSGNDSLSFIILGIIIAALITGVTYYLVKRKKKEGINE